MSIRQNYYKNLGLKGKNVSQEIEFAFKQNKIEIPKLEWFCLSAGLSHVQRHFIYKIILGVIPTLSTAWRAAHEARLYQFNVLFNAFKENMPERLVYMMLLQNNYSPFEIPKRRLPPHLFSILKGFLDIFDDFEQQDSFWMFCLFVERFHVPFDSQIPDIHLQWNARLLDLLTIHAKPLVVHLSDLNFDYKYTSKWYLAYFSNVFELDSLEG
jgi:hypothetical protein